MNCRAGCNGTLSDIRATLARSISEKDSLLPAYRKNLGPGARVWLLLYTTAEVSRSMPIPFGIEQWRFPFGFDRVFWFASLEGTYVEILAADSIESRARVPA